MSYRRQIDNRRNWLVSQPEFPLDKKGQSSKVDAKLSGLGLGKSRFDLVPETRRSGEHVAPCINNRAIFYTEHDHVFSQIQIDTD